MFVSWSNAHVRANQQWGCIPGSAGTVASPVTVGDLGLARYLAAAAQAIPGKHTKPGNVASHVTIDATRLISKLSYRQAVRAPNVTSYQIAHELVM